MNRLGQSNTVVLIHSKLKVQLGDGFIHPLTLGTHVSAPVHIRLCKRDEQKGFTGPSCRSVLIATAKDVIAEKMQKWMRGGDGIVLSHSRASGLPMELPAAVSPLIWHGLLLSWALMALSSLPDVPDLVSLSLACTGSLGLRTTALLARAGFCQIRNWLSIWFDNCKIWYKWMGWGNGVVLWEWKMADLIWKCTLQSLGLRRHLCGWTFLLGKKKKY